ncbi:MAG: glucose-6-phosphate isomerase [Bacteroidales bacterium]|jgi:glucose-6-phosphate isomerase|nr:glucose-6-phosphate isomerase [Bacteroidales bacterium]
MSTSITLEKRYLQPFISSGDINKYMSRVQEVHHQLLQRSGTGNQFLGWLSLPNDTAIDLQEHLSATGNRLAKQSEVVVVVGIGGSYLGARAVIDALSPYFSTTKGQKGNPEIVYAGNHLSENYLFELIQYIKDKEYSIIVISKSGTTTEPAIAFRILRAHCEQKYGIEGSKERIVAITDRDKGALKNLSEKAGYATYEIPDDVGGRYSVLTPVGLLPIAVAGFSIKNLLDGARQMQQQLCHTNNFEQNIGMQYALFRYLLYQLYGKKIELMVAYEPKMFYFIEWFKQLFGESEGKALKGIFPAGAIFSTDLHSLGQYIQEGERTLFETVISIGEGTQKLPIPHDLQNIDKLNYLTHHSIDHINHLAEEGTCTAHADGGVPCLRLLISHISEHTLGELIYFFEYSCALSGYLLKVNPFDQPGVEAYKKNMFALLGKK